MNKPRQQDRAQKSKALILEAARKAFARFGFEGANMRDIASEIGITHTLIRYHFGSKLKLWQAVVDDIHVRLAEATAFENHEFENLEPKERFRVYIRRYIQFCAEYPEEARITINEAMIPSERLEYLVQHVRREHSAILPFVREMMEDGAAPETWLVSYFYSVAMMCQMPFLLAEPIRQLYKVEMHSPEAINAHCEAVLAFILGDEPSDKGAWPKLPDWAKAAGPE